MDARYAPHTGAEHVEVSPNVFFQLPGVAILSNVPHDGMETEFELAFDGTRVAPMSVRVSSQTGVAVTGSDLREIAVGTLTNILAVGMDVGSALALRDGWLKSDEELSQLRSEGPTANNVQYAAEVYLMGRALGAAPAEFMQFHLGLSRPTAARWLRKAREAGLIDGDD